MQVQTIVNRSEKHRSFVYRAARLVQVPTLATAGIDIGQSNLGRAALVLDKLRASFANHDGRCVSV